MDAWALSGSVGLPCKAPSSAASAGASYAPQAHEQAPNSAALGLDFTDGEPSWGDSSVGGCGFGGLGGLELLMARAAAESQKLLTIDDLESEIESETESLRELEGESEVTVAIPATAATSATTAPTAPVLAAPDAPDAPAAQAAQAAQAAHAAQAAQAVPDDSVAHAMKAASSNKNANSIHTSRRDRKKREPSVWQPHRRAVDIPPWPEPEPGRSRVHPTVAPTANSCTLDHETDGSCARECQLLDAELTTLVLALMSREHFCDGKKEVLNTMSCSSRRLMCGPSCSSAHATF